MNAWQSILLDAALKSALVLVLAWLAVTLMRQTSAAARHLVWFLAVAALLLLPILSWALPGWHVLPGWMEIKPHATEIPPQAAQVLAAPAPVVAPEMAVEAPPVTEPMPLAAPPKLPPVDRPVLTPELPKLPGQTVATAMDFSRRALVVWLAVALIALVPAILGMMSLWRLEWGARREDEPGWLQLLQRLVERLGIWRRVRLLKSGRRRMPMTWGVIRPRLLLPEESRDWPEERRRVVMLHELAHAKRLDYLTNLATQFACAIYWFNPLVWLAARRMAAERERACDDIVLNHGAKPADYAEQVLQIAAGLPIARFGALGGIPMARRSGLEGRLRAILDGTRNRTALSRAVLFAMFVALAIVVVPVAMLKAAAPVTTNGSISLVGVIAPLGSNVPPSLASTNANTNQAYHDPWGNPYLIAILASTNGNTNQVYRDPWGSPYLIAMDMRDGAAASNNAPTAPASGISTNSANRLWFLPEVERVLDTRGALGGRAYLSFSNGVVVEESNAENAQRNRQLHRDLKLQTIEGEQEWTGVDLQVAPATEDLWNTPADQLVAALADNLAPPLPTMQVTPGVWFFKTRDGTYGLLRIVGFVEPRPGDKAMDVVYKLARPLVAQKKQADLNSPLPERIKQFLAGERATTGRGLEIWEQDPAGTLVLRKDLVTTEIHQEGDTQGIWILGHVYYLKSANRFYIQWEGGMGASTLHYYGPFDGDPVKVLGLPTTNAAADQGRGKIIVEAVNPPANRSNLRDLQAEVVSSNGQRVSVPLKPTGPGRYEGTMPAGWDGTNAVNVPGSPARNWAEVEWAPNGVVVGKSLSFNNAQAAGVWGEAVEGISVGLAAEKKVWGNGETPELLARIRNQGANAVNVGPRQELAELEVDGVWYDWKYGYSIRDGSLDAGREVDNINVTLGVEWGTVATSAAGFGRINLSPGKHTVRFAVAGGAAQNRFRAVSNPVEIEIAGAANTNPPSAWGETKDGLRSRLVAETNVFPAGQPISMRIEVQNVGDQVRRLSYPTAPYFDVVQVTDAGGHRAPFLGTGLLQLANQETNLSPGASAIFEPFDLAQTYFVRTPGRYTVKWTEQFSAVPPSGEFQFDLTGVKDRAESDELVGRLLPLSISSGSSGWLDDSPANPAMVGTTNETQPFGRLWLQGGHYQKSAGLRPGGNWTTVPGYAFVIHRDRYGSRMANTNYDATVVWLWLTDIAAGSGGMLRDGLPASEYLGKISRWHVYISADAKALKAWPTAKEDIQRALGGEAGGEHADWGEPVDGISIGLTGGKTIMSWDSDKTPELLARVRNQGTSTALAQYDQGWAQLEVDGVWYHHNFAWDAPDPPLRPGQEVDDIKVMLGTDWIKINTPGREQLQLTPGKHTFRVRYNWDAGQHTTRDIAVSNPVEAIFWQ